MAEAPTVYILYGEDGSAIAEAIQSIKARLGDPAIAEMNSTVFASSPLSLDELRAAALASPFLAERRLVVIEEASQYFSRAESRAPLISLLDEAPPSTALVLTEPSSLAKTHWLLKWADGAGGRAFVKEFALPKGGAMVAWIQEKAKELGGEIETRAASSLAALVGSDTRAAANEIEKLLAFANYSRAVTINDVNELALEIGEQGDFFGLIDALSAGNGAQAMGALRKLMDERDLISLFFGLVGHFRVLLQAREIVDAGGKEADVASRLSVHPYRAKKLTGQCRRFSPATLETIYERLLELDHQVKTGEISPDLAMETLTAALSSQPA